MYSESDALVDSPLSMEDIQTIDKSKLSSIDKHYLRILAHCLSCLKKMANDSKIGFFPNENVRLEWLRNQIPEGQDDDFLEILLHQFESASKKFEKLAKLYQISPLELTLQHLIDSLENGKIDN